METDGTAKGVEYFYKEFSLYAANEDIELYKKLYEEYAASEVWDFMAVKKAHNYVPERK